MGDHRVGHCRLVKIIDVFIFPTVDYCEREAVDLLDKHPCNVFRSIDEIDEMSLGDSGRAVEAEAMDYVCHISERTDLIACNGKE